MFSRHHLPTFKIIMRRHKSGDDVVDILVEPAVRAEQPATLVEDMRRIEGLRTVSYGVPGKPTVRPR